jgi:hypothetical protein
MFLWELKKKINPRNPPENTVNVIKGDFVIPHPKKKILVVKGWCLRVFD